MHRGEDILRVDLAGLDLRNPVLLAAGTAGHLDEMAEVLDLSRIGGVVTKSITPLPREGHPAWRVAETRAGMLNAVGLANPGLEHFVEHVVPRAAAVPAVVIASIAGFRVEDYVCVAAELDPIPAIPAVEINVSCPNVRGGTEFGSDPGALRELVAALRPVLARTRMFVKLSPIPFSPPGMTAIALAAIEGAGRAQGPCARPGADALCISNTLPAMAIDVRTRRPRLSNVTGGLSGPAIHHLAVRLVHDVHSAVAHDAGIPIVGVGGVSHWEDAAEFILAGASAVQMGTALFADPRSPIKVARGLARWARRQGAASIMDLVGRMLR